MSAVDIRLAAAGDRQEMIDLLWRASLAWEAVRQDLLDHPEVIDVDPQMIASGQVFAAERDGRIVGFATIVPHEGNEAELDGIFVEPAEWRHGIGAALLRRIEDEALAWGCRRLHVLASPNVEGFYIAAGFIRTGEQKMRFGPPAVVMLKALQA